MKRLAIVVVLVLAVVGVSSADPISCSQQTAPDVLLGNFSCSLGGLTFQNFAATNGAGVPNPQVNILLTSHVGPDGTVFLDFNPNLSALAGSVDIIFSFQVLGGIDQIDLQVGGVGAVISEIACSAPANGTACPAGTFLGAASAGSQQATQFSALFPTTSPVYISKDIDVSAIDGVAGHLSFFEQSFHTQVPEPASMVLLGSGLLAIGGMIRKRLQN